MMLARNSTSSDHSSFLPSESSIKNEAGSSHETEYSPPTTINGSESPKSSSEENAGTESLTANCSPSTTPNLSTTSAAIVSTTTNTTPLDKTASQLLINGLKNVAQLPPLDMNSVFGNFFSGTNNKLPNLLNEQQKTNAATPPNSTSTNYGMNGIVDPTAFLQHFLASQSPHIQLQGPPSPLLKSEFKHEINQINNNNNNVQQDRKRVR